MPKQVYTEEEKAKADAWLALAARYLANARGTAKACKRRACKIAGSCMASDVPTQNGKNACGHPLQEGDVALTVHLALFGMLIEAGFIKQEPSPAAEAYKPQ